MDVHVLLLVVGSAGCLQTTHGWTGRTLKTRPPTLYCGDGQQQLTEHNSQSRIFLPCEWYLVMGVSWVSHGRLVQGVP